MEATAWANHAVQDMDVLNVIVFHGVIKMEDV